MPKLVIFLKDNEEVALAMLSEREFRDPRSQAAYIIRETLERLGLISQDVTVNKSDNNIDEN
jgi:hypothetical protein